MSRFPLLFINGMDMKRNKARITRILLLLYNTDIQKNHEIRKICIICEIRVIRAQISI